MLPTVVSCHPYTWGPPPPTNCPMRIDMPGDNDLDSVLDGLAKVIADGAGAL